jgi:predicted nuclease of predicted toxin-antitoxin system
MKLLFDHNLSPRLVRLLADLYPDSQHVFLRDLSLVRDFPPKVVWLRRGNCSTSTIEIILRSKSIEIQAFSQDLSLGILTLF